VDYSTDRLVIKPTSGGSSIDVFTFEDSQKAIDKAFEIAGRYRNHTALIEPFCQGVEFTIIVLQSHEGNPVALMPTEIETNYDQGSIFDYRRKYLATNQATYHTPARFSSVQIAQIQSDAQKLFSHLEITDFTRFDGWLLQDGTIVFTDLNPISGMEQNSFLFQQTSRIGLTHGETLRYMIVSAAKRYQINLPSLPDVEQKNKKNVHVLFGGDTAERQVSVMSGTNVWLKLLSSDHYKPYPFLLDPDGSIWQLPYSLALSHTVEEIVMNCNHLQTEKMDSSVSIIRKNLSLNSEMSNVFVVKPRKMSRQEFYTLSHERQAFVFLGLHGGDGEGGVMQQALEDQNLYYNGSHASAAKLCMDKYETGRVINALAHPFVSSTMKESVAVIDLLPHPDVTYRTTWNTLTQNLKAEMLIVKPQGDGCSAGIVKLTSADDLQRYIQLLRDKASFIPQGSFTGQGDIIEMPSAQTTHLLFEPFIVTDKIVTQDGVLHFDKKSGWIELTIGIREVNDIYHALNPSITVADADVLSLEEKFQGGTGVNLTPPPSDIVAPHILTQTRDVMQDVAKALGIRNYARIDFFLQVDTGHIIVIEANTLPGLTPSTVIYHQALSETPPQSPRAFLENIIHDAWKM
jgi:D-alanine-D-alanine ligase-like ATP-grasp enzyme